MPTFGSETSTRALKNTKKQLIAGGKETHVQTWKSRVIPVRPHHTPVKLCVSRESPGIESTFVFVGVVFVLTLSIYGSHVGRWLVPCCSLCDLSTQRLSVSLLQQALVRQVFPTHSDCGARMAACLQLVLVSIVIARWSKELFVFLIFWLFVLIWIIINRSFNCFRKNGFLKTRSNKNHNWNVGSPR
jgi:hypothetical protein